MELLLRADRVFTASKLGVFQPGAIGIDQGRIHFVGLSADIADSEADKVLHFPGAAICPGLVDCHVHLMESASFSLHHAQGSGQELAARANLMTALKSGITSVGDHGVADGRIPQPMSFYLNVASSVPMTVKMAFGVGVLGTDPPVIGSAATPGQTLTEDQLTSELFHQLAQNNQFPGENIFLNATPADLPLALTPRAGDPVISWGKVEEMIRIFHENGKKIGAHAEGDLSVENFAEYGGDVIHHAHGVSSRIAQLLAQRGIRVVVTPHGGTSEVPNSPDDLLMLLRAGIEPAIASDSYLPVHHKAAWIPRPAGTILGPPDFLLIAGSVLKPLLACGFSINNLLQLITRNGAEILGLDDTGTLEPGKSADLLVCSGVPALETTEITDIRTVFLRGEIVVNRAAG